MTLNRISLAALFGMLLAASFFVLDSDAQTGTLRQIVPGVWFREGEIKEMGHCNNIIIEMKDYLIVVDANFPSGARMAMSDARRVSQKPVKYVFDTHHHGDHAYGNPVWTQAGATTLAYKGVTEEMQRYEPKGWQAASKSRKDVGDLHLETAEPPKQTFDKSPFVLDDGQRKVQFHHFGWAHTRGDGFVYLPKERVICTGDALVNGPYNFTGQGNIQNWSNVLRSAQKLKIEYVLPGHGAPGGKELFDGQILFFTELQKAVKGAIDSGKKAEELMANIQMPETVKNWTGDGLPRQLKDVYEEMTQGKPHGEILGGK
jgi:glyoxylase-like metal-dependent hydrolase (beta-lactamase superfamily II)